MKQSRKRRHNRALQIRSFEAGGATSVKVSLCYFKAPGDGVSHFILYLSLFEVKGKCEDLLLCTVTFLPITQNKKRNKSLLISSSFKR